MTLIKTVSTCVETWTRPVQAGGYVLVPTFAVYPSNGVVQLFVEGGAETFVVSDGGGALNSLLASGGPERLGRRHLAEIAGRSGFKVSNSGWIFGQAQGREELVAVIGAVADASRTAAEQLLRLFKPHHHPDFRRELHGLVKDAFAPSELELRPRLLGASNKSHTFDYAIRVHERPTLVLDAVVPEANSINKVVVSHIDIRQAGRPGLEQRIIYDDRVRWSGADLALLEVGATSLAFSAVPQLLRSFGAEVAVSAQR